MKKKLIQPGIVYFFNFFLYLSRQPAAFIFLYCWFWIASATYFLWNHHDMTSQSFLSHHHWTLAYLSATYSAWNTLSTSVHQWLYIICNWKFQSFATVFMFGEIQVTRYTGTCSICHWVNACAYCMLTTEKWPNGYTCVFGVYKE